MDSERSFVASAENFRFYRLGAGDRGRDAQIAEVGVCDLNPRYVRVAVIRLHPNYASAANVRFDGLHRSMAKARRTAALGRSCRLNFPRAR